MGCDRRPRLFARVAQSQFGRKGESPTALSHRYWLTQPVGATQRMPTDAGKTGVSRWCTTFSGYPSATADLTTSARLRCPEGKIQHVTSMKYMLGALPSTSTHPEHSRQRGPACGFWQFGPRGCAIPALTEALPQLTNSIAKDTAKDVGGGRG